MMLKIKHEMDRRSTVLDRGTHIESQPHQGRSTLLFHTTGRTEAVEVDQGTGMSKAL
jgi:hypothetical protein